MEFSKSIDGESTYSLESVISSESTSSDNLKSKLEAISLNGRNITLGLPRRSSLGSLKKKRKSIISISRPNSRKLKKLEDEKNIKKEWVDDFINMFIVPEQKLHINDNSAVVTREESIKRIYQLAIISSVILALVASTLLMQLDYSSKTRLQVYGKGLTILMSNVFTNLLTPTFIQDGQKHRISSLFISMENMLTLQQMRLFHQKRILISPFLCPKQDTGKIVVILMHNPRDQLVIYPMLIMNGSSYFTLMGKRISPTLISKRKSTEQSLIQLLQ